MNRNEEGAINRDPTPSQNDASIFARVSAPAPKPPVDIYKRVFSATEGLCGVYRHFSVYLLYLIDQARLTLPERERTELGAIWNLSSG